jgi:hypothetical protein
VRRIASGPVNAVFSDENLRLAYGGRVEFLAAPGAPPTRARRRRQGSCAAWGGSGHEPCWISSPTTPCAPWRRAGALLGLVAGSLGTFAVLRRQSLLGDAVSHAALPGIVLAFMLTGSKAPLVLVLGAALAGWAASLLVMLVVRTTRIKMDTALGLMLSTFFGLGLVLMSVIQRTAGEGMAGLEHFLFGQAATLVGEDLQTMGGLGGAGAAGPGLAVEGIQAAQLRPGLRRRRRAAGARPEYHPDHACWSSPSSSACRPWAWC